MKTLLAAAFSLLAICGFAAVPPYSAFKGTNGIVVRTNPPTGDVIIDGSGIMGPTNGVTATQVTNIVTTAVTGLSNSFPSVVDVIWEGDSLTTDTSPPAGAGNTWPAFLRTNLLWSGVYRYTNASRGGRTAENIVTQYATNIQSRWLPDYRSEKGIYFDWSGINDILNGGKSGETTFSFLKTNWAAAAHDGLKVVAFTIATNLLFGNNSTFNDRRVTLNNLIRSNAQLYDVLIDIDRLYGNGSSTNTDVFIDGVHYTASNNNYIANFVYTNMGPFQPRYIPYVNGLPTNKYDGFLFGNIFMGNWSGDAALQYIAIGQSAFRTNGLGPAILQGPDGDTVINSGGSNPLRLDLNVVNYALLDTDGRFKSLGGGFDAPGGNFRAPSAIFTNTFSVPDGAVSNKVWACTNSTTGQGEWRTVNSGVTNLAGLYDVSIVSPQQGDLLQFQGGDNRWHNFPAFFQVFYNITVVSNVTINVGTNIEQNLAIAASNSFGLAFNGTPLPGEMFNVAVSNYNTTADILMTNASSYDTEFGQLVSTYLCPSNAISVFSFVNRTNWNAAGTGRWELSNASRRKRDLLDATTSKADQFVQTAGGTAIKAQGAFQFTGNGTIIDSDGQNRIDVPSSSVGGPLRFYGAGSADVFISTTGNVALSAEKASPATLSFTATNRTQLSQLQAPRIIQTNNYWELPSNAVAGVLVGNADGTGTNQINTVAHGAGMLTNNGTGTFGWMTIPAGGGGGITGSGTAYKIPKWTSSSAIGDSSLETDVNNTYLLYTQSASANGSHSGFQINGASLNAGTAEYSDFYLSYGNLISYNNDSIMDYLRTIRIDARPYNSGGGTQTYVTNGATFFIEGPPKGGSFLTIIDATPFMISNGLPRILSLNTNGVLFRDTHGFVTNAVGITLAGTGNNIGYLVENRLIATNSATSNIVVNFSQTNTVEIWLTNNATFTNWTGIADDAQRNDKLFIIRPQLITRGINWGNLGLSNPGYSVAIATNANNLLWTSLTNGKTYALSLTRIRTNIFPTLTLWE